MVVALHFFSQWVNMLFGCIAKTDYAIQHRLKQTLGRPPLQGIMGVNPSPYGD